MGQAFLQLCHSSPVCIILPSRYTGTPFTYHWCCMIFSNLQYLKIHVYCDVTRFLWVCCSACFEGTTILWTVTPYAISDTVSHTTRHKFSNTAVRNSKLAIYSTVKSNIHPPLPAYLLSQHTRHITHSLLYDERSLFYLTNIVCHFLQLFHHTSASSCMGHINMTSYAIEVTNITCQMKWEYSTYNKTKEG